MCACARAEWSSAQFQSIEFHSKALINSTIENKARHSPMMLHGWIELGNVVSKQIPKPYSHTDIFSNNFYIVSNDKKYVKH